MIQAATSSRLSRSLNLNQATAINMIDMVGIGPFITIPLVISAMNGPACMLAWLLGGILSFADGMVWAELGAKWPQAGGSYQFLRKLFGENKWGSLFSFLFIWQTTIQAPLVIASGTIGFSQYLSYLVPLTTWEQKAVSGLLVVFLTILLYRRIGEVGQISIVLWVVVVITLLWVIITGLSYFNPQRVFDFSSSPSWFSSLFFVGLGNASIKTIYSYLGYYNVCHLGGEIENPERNIPRSILLSIVAITVIYLLMQLSVLSVIPWQEAKNSQFIVSTFFERIYGSTTAIAATVLILWIALASLFSVMLGYSRVPYAAAVDGNYFPIFARLHPKKQFPHVSLLILAAVAFIFSLLFKLREVITAIIVMRILVQFVSQSVGIILLHFRRREIENRNEETEKKKDENLVVDHVATATPFFPFKMWLFPIPPLIAIAIWMFIFFSSGEKYIFRSLAFIVAGVVMFLIFSYQKKQWPFRKIES